MLETKLGLGKDLGKGDKRKKKGGRDVWELKLPRIGGASARSMLHACGDQSGA
jgi:hypothetical protein